jgi:hypothetical protein
MTSELVTESRPATAVECFPEPEIDDLTIRHGEEIKTFLARSTIDRAIELRRFINANLHVLPDDLAQPLCRALHGEHFRPSLFELVVARTLQVLGARALSYEVATATGRRPDLHVTFTDGRIVVDATVPEFDAEIVKAHEANQRLIDIIEALIPTTWTFFVERLPSIGPNDSQREFKSALLSIFATLPASSEGFAPLSYEVAAGHPQGEIRLLLGARPAHWQRAYGGGPASAAWGDTDARVEKALRRKRSQLRGSDVPALIAIAGGMGEAIEDIDIALFGRTWERHGESQKPVEFGFDPSGIWGKLRGGETVLAGVLVFCHWQWTLGDDPVLYVNPRFGGSLPRALKVLHRREFRGGSIAPTAARFSGFFPILRGAAGLKP